MQAVCGASNRCLLGSHRHDPGPTFTLSFSIFPALKVGNLDADIETASPVPGLRPVRAGRLLVPKVPNPGTGTSSPSASASPMIANTPSTASLATALLRPVLARQPTGNLRLVHRFSSPMALFHHPLPGCGIVRFERPTTTNRPRSRCPPAPRRPACRRRFRGQCGATAALVLAPGTLAGRPGPGGFALLSSALRRR